MSAFLKKLGPHAANSKGTSRTNSASTSKCRPKSPARRPLRQHHDQGACRDMWTFDLLESVVARSLRHPLPRPQSRLHRRRRHRPRSRHRSRHRHVHHRQRSSHLGLGTRPSRPGRHHQPHRRHSLRQLWSAPIPTSATSRTRPFARRPRRLSIPSGQRQRHAAAFPNAITALNVRQRIRVAEQVPLLGRDFPCDEKPGATAVMLLPPRLAAPLRRIPHILGRTIRVDEVPVQSSESCRPAALPRGHRPLDAAHRHPLRKARPPRPHDVRAPRPE